MQLSLPATHKPCCRWSLQQGGPWSRQLKYSSAMRRQARRLQACLGDAGSAAGTLLSERLASSGLACASGTTGAGFATAAQGLQRGDRRALRAAARAYATLVRQQGGQAGAVVAGTGTGAVGLRRTLQARVLL